APQLHKRTEARLERRSRAVKLVAVKRQSRLHPERVARTETAGDYAARRAGFEDRAEKLRGGRRRSEKLKAVFAGVAGARDDASHACDFGGHHGEPPHLAKRRVA